MALPRKHGCPGSSYSIKPGEMIEAAVRSRT
jgi:hypothetical protein